MLQDTIPPSEIDMLITLLTALCDKRMVISIELSIALARAYTYDLTGDPDTPGRLGDFIHASDEE